MAALTCLCELVFPRAILHETVSKNVLGFVFAAVYIVFKRISQRKSILTIFPA